MKTRNLMILVVLIFNIAAIQAQTSIFDKLSKNKNVTTVYISKTMLSMVPDMDMMNVKGLTDKLDHMEIYTTENKEAKGIMKTETDLLASDKKYEIIMAVRETDQNVTFYAHKDNNFIKDLIMFVDGAEEESTVIRFTGTFTVEDIQQITKGK